MLRTAIALPLLALLSACSHTPAASSPHVLLLGEVHDNAIGHAERAALLRERIDAGWRPVIAMEQFDTGQQAALDAAMRDCADADCVVAKVAPAKSSWTWDYYKPVVALALDRELPLLAANLSRSDASKIVKGGFAAALPAELIARYQLDTLPAPLLAAQATEVRDSHCGMLPEAMVEPMAKAQIARDVMMADTMRTHATDGIVLIAGNGHVRGDIGVPFWLRRDGLAPQAVGFLEPGTDAAGFDIARRIPPAERPDPCAQFKAPKPVG
ncbi:ChaN family lipoprotein [Thermomonas sp. HDW16]|uniref:ChaN family lipoprotein n=1 Tax=Thermomonas sp. HDW16 TaxID=2714945 RepID=UPI00140D9FDD|nr:ChaN family lipoprotein [Thermomonas sp. HDW16]QIL20852.1 ChaN family lipoprotein [Thermomonas sp. HDW16]